MNSAINTKMAFYQFYSISPVVCNLSMRVKNICLSGYFTFEMAMNSSTSWPYLRILLVMMYEIYKTDKSATKSFTTSTVLLALTTMYRLRHSVLRLANSLINPIKNAGIQSTGDFPNLFQLFLANDIISIDTLTSLRHII